MLAIGSSLLALAFEVDFSLKTLEGFLHVSALPLLGGGQHGSERSLGAVRLLRLRLLPGILDDLE